MIMDSPSPEYAPDRAEDLIRLMERMYPPPTPEDICTAHTTEARDLVFAKAARATVVNAMRRRYKL